LAIFTTIGRFVDHISNIDIISALSGHIGMYISLSGDILSNGHTYSFLSEFYYSRSFISICQIYTCDWPHLYLKYVKQSTNKVIFLKLGVVSFEAHSW